MDGSSRIQQKLGFKSKREAEKAREQVIAELYNGTYCVQGNVSVVEFLEFWLEEDIKKRIKSHDTYNTFRSTVKNHIVPVLGKIGRYGGFSSKRIRCVSVMVHIHLSNFVVKSYINSVIKYFD